jgi:hypothetical protein
VRKVLGKSQAAESRSENNYMRFFLIHDGPHCFERRLKMQIKLIVGKTSKPRED